MKKIAYYLMAVVILFTACDNEIDKSQFQYEPKPIAVTGVKLDLSELTLALGSSATLEATVTPERATNQEVIWTSSNASVATVNEKGKISTVKLGETIITATTEDGGFKATCTLTVVSGFPVTSVSLNKSALTLYVGGETETLMATLSPDNATTKLVRWSSSDEDVADVDDSGKVSAVGPGEAVITVTTVDGDHTATCTVTIIQSVEGVELNETSITLQVGESKILSYTVLPENATNQAVQWSVSGKGIEITIDAETGVVIVTRIAGGEGFVTVITEDGGFEAICSFPDADPNAIFYGVDSKVWTWLDTGRTWGNGPLDSFGSDPGWWGMTLNVPDGEGRSVNQTLEAASSKDGEGAFMTFSKMGLALVKTKADGSTVSGTFSVDMSKGKQLSNGTVWSIGLLTTKDVTILWGVENQDDVAEADLTPRYEFDIIKATEDELILSWPYDYPHNDPDMVPWSGAWFWKFQAK